MAELPGVVEAQPALDLWVRIDPRETITVRTGKVEIGQGILTALTLIAAEELDVEPARVRIESAVTGRSPNELITAGSMSVEDSGSAMRQACAQARRIMLERAASDLGVEPAALRVTDGEIGVPGANRTVSYWDVQGGRPFGVQTRGTGGEKSSDDYRVVGKGIGRIDLPAEGEGRRRVRPRSRRCRVCCTRAWCVRRGITIACPRSIARASMRDSELVRLIVDGSFVAVVAEAEHAAVRLMEQAARAREVAAARRNWRFPPISPTFCCSTRRARFRSSTACRAKRRCRNCSSPNDSVKVRASYSRPYVMHASLAPSAAAALWEPTV